MKTTIVKKWMLLVFALVLAFTLVMQVEPALAGISTTPSDKVCGSCRVYVPEAANHVLSEAGIFSFTGNKLPFSAGPLWR